MAADFAKKDAFSSSDLSEVQGSSGIESYKTKDSDNPAVTVQDNGIKLNAIGADYADATDYSQEPWSAHHDHPAPSGHHEDGWEQGLDATRAEQGWDATRAEQGWDATRVEQGWNPTRAETEPAAFNDKASYNRELHGDWGHEADWEHGDGYQTTDYYGYEGDGLDMSSYEDSWNQGTDYYEQDGYDAANNWDQGQAYTQPKTQWQGQHPGHSRGRGGEHASQRWYSRGQGGDPGPHRGHSRGRGGVYASQRGYSRARGGEHASQKGYSRGRGRGTAYGSHQDQGGWDPPHYGDHSQWEEIKTSTPDAKTKERDATFCICCKIQFSDEKSYEDHKNGFMHKSKMSGQAPVSTISKKVEEPKKKSPSPEPEECDLEESEEEEDSSTCKYCKIDFKTPDMYFTHTRGLMHMQRRLAAKKDKSPKVVRKEKEEGSDKSSDEEEDSSRCKYCNISFANRDSYFQHTRGLNHIQNRLNAKAAKRSANTDKPQKDSDAQASTENNQKGEADEEDEGVACCTVCNIVFEDPVAYRRHTRGLIHTQKALMACPDKPAVEDDSSWKQMVPCILRNIVVKPVKDLLPDNIGRKQFPDEFCCKICGVKCTSDKTYQQHLEGAKHKEFVDAVERGDMEPVLQDGMVTKTAEIDVPAIIQEKLDECTGPLIGLQFITEFRMAVAEDGPIRYVCNLCEAKCDPNVLISHLQGNKHRMKYIKEHYPAIRQEVKLNCVKKSDLTEMCEAACKNIEETEGRHTVKVKLEYDSIAEEEPVPAKKQKISDEPEPEYDRVEPDVSQVDSGRFPPRMDDDRPYPRRDDGPYPRRDDGPNPRHDDGPYPRHDDGPYTRRDDGPYPRHDDGPNPRRDDGPYPRHDDGPYTRHDDGPYPRRDDRPFPRHGDGRLEPERNPHVEYYFDPRYPDGPIYGRGRHSRERPDFDLPPWGRDRPPPYYDVHPWGPGRRSPGFDRHPYDRSPPDRHFWEGDHHRRDGDEDSPDRDPHKADGEPAYDPYQEDIRSLSGLDVSKETDRKRFMEIARNRGLLEPEQKDRFPGEDMRGYQTPQQVDRERERQRIFHEERYRRERFWRKNPKLYKSRLAAESKDKGESKAQQELLEILKEALDSREKTHTSKQPGSSSAAPTASTNDGLVKSFVSSLKSGGSTDKIAGALQQLSSGLVNSEHDAAMALGLSNALTQALMQYRQKGVPSRDSNRSKPRAELPKQYSFPPERRHSRSPRPRYQSSRGSKRRSRSSSASSSTTSSSSSSSRSRSGSRHYRHSDSRRRSSPPSSSKRSGLYFSSSRSSRNPSHRPSTKSSPPRQSQRPARKPVAFLQAPPKKNLTNQLISTTQRLKGSEKSANSNSQQQLSTAIYQSKAAVVKASIDLLEATYGTAAKQQAVIAKEKSSPGPAQPVIDLTSISLPPTTDPGLCQSIPLPAQPALPPPLPVASNQKKPPPPPGKPPMAARFNAYNFIKK